MGNPLLYEILEKPGTSCVIALCCSIWFYVYKKKTIGYSHLGLNYDYALQGHHWRIVTSALSHISFIHLVFNMSALWSLGALEQLVGLQFYLHCTLLLILCSGFLVLAIYDLLIRIAKIDYFRRVTAVGYSCVVFGLMTVLSMKQPSSKLDLFGFLSLPISFAPFESLIFTSIMVPQASFVGHLSGIIVGYCIAWGLIHGMNNYWAVSILGWVVIVFVFSLKNTGVYEFAFIHIQSDDDHHHVANDADRDPLLPTTVNFIPTSSGNATITSAAPLPPVAGAHLV